MWSFEEFIDDRYPSRRTAVTDTRCKEDNTRQDKQLEQSDTADSSTDSDPDTDSR